MAKTLLLIEDDNILLGMYQKLLSNHGYVVHTAENGEEGLKKSQQEHPDLILLDLMMPKMNGITMLKALRRDDWGKNAKVIILTNLNPNDDILLEVIDNHPTYYLIKSNTTAEQVLGKVKEILEEEKKDINTAY